MYYPSSDFHSVPKIPGLSVENDGLFGLTVRFFKKLLLTQVTFAALLHKRASANNSRPVQTL